MGDVERKVCSHRADEDADGACAECYGLVVSALSAARSTLASSERERDEWKEKCREANRQRSRVWGRAERAEEAASRLAAIEAALRTEQAQHALTKRGHNNAVAWVASLLEDAVRADTAESALSAAREEARAAERRMFQARDIAAEHVAEESKLRHALAASESSARRLREALEATATYLAEQEWSAWRSSDGGREDFIGAACCPECGGMQSEGHASASCRLETLVAAARAALGSSPGDTKGETT